MFEISPKVYASMFSLPTKIADEALKFANGEQLKVIISVFRNSKADEEEISKATNLSLDAVSEALEYWLDAGVLESKGVPAVKTEKDTGEIDKVQVPLPQIHFVNPTQAEITKLIEQNGSMNRLFNEAQLILGRTIGYTMQCVIYSIVNFYGLKPDVVNCLLYFAKSIGSTSQNDIQKIAKYWAENGITNQGAADEYIMEAANANDFYHELAKRTGNSAITPSYAVLEMVNEWIKWGFDIDSVCLAFDIMKAEKQTGRLNWNNMRHMNGTIKNWKSSGMFTVEDIEKGTKRFASKGNKSNENKETSFDVELAEKNAKENPVDFGRMKNKRRTRKREAK